MRITGVRTVLYEYPLRHPIGDVQSHGITRMADLAVFLETDAALVGVAIADADHRDRARPGGGAGRPRSEGRPRTL